jgi:hypothetical protein
VVFLDRKSLDTFSKLSGFEMSLNGLTVKLVKSAIDPEASSVLQTMWIRVHEVPGFAREADIIKEMTKLVAEPLVVDELSLIRASLVRVQGRCRNPGAIKGQIEFFFNGTGYFVKFDVEGPQGAFKGGKGGPPGPRKSDDFPKKDDHDDDYKGDESKRTGSKFDRIGRIDKDMEFGHEESMEEDIEPVQGNQDKEGKVNSVEHSGMTSTIPKKMDVPVGGTLTLGDTSQAKLGSTQELGSEELLIPNDSQFVVHGREGT